jgi:hypothetical protein
LAHHARARHPRHRLSSPHAGSRGGGRACGACVWWGGEVRSDRDNYTNVCSSPTLSDKRCHYISLSSLAPGHPHPHTYTHAHAYTNTLAPRSCTLGGCRRRSLRRNSSRARLLSPASNGTHSHTRLSAPPSPRALSFFLSLSRTRAHQTQGTAIAVAGPRCCCSTGRGVCRSDGSYLVVNVNSSCVHAEEE